MILLLGYSDFLETICKVGAYITGGSALISMIVPGWQPLTTPLITLYKWLGLASNVFGFVADILDEKNLAWSGAKNSACQFITQPISNNEIQTFAGVTCDVLIDGIDYSSKNYKGTYIPTNFDIKKYNCTYNCYFYPAISK